MKKILSTVAALGMVAGMATAAQALEFSVSGYYFVEGAYMNSADGTGVVPTVDADNFNGLDTGVNESLLTSGVTLDDEAPNDDYWFQEFVIKPVMKVNDKVVMKSKIYLASNKFGSGKDLDVTDGGQVKVHHLYLEYMSPIGKLRVGRTSAGLWQGAFLSTDSYANRVMYFPNFLPKPLGACVFLQKSQENDSEVTSSSVTTANLTTGAVTTTTTTTPNDTNDQDFDLYEISGWYKTKDLKIALAYDYYDMNNQATADADRNRIKGYYNQNMGNIYAEMEFSYDWGTVDPDDDPTLLIQEPDYDTDTCAIMADVGMTMDKLDVGMMFIYASGDDDDTDNDEENESAMAGPYSGLGEQFQPYQILTGRHTGMLSDDVNGINADMAFHGIMSLGVHADFAVTDKLSLHSAIAYAKADTDSIKWTIGYDALGNPVNWDFDIDDEYGWEIDLGVSYALLDNLTYSVDFGYLMTGDFFEGYETLGAGPFGDAEDIFVLNHRLSMEF